MRGNVLVRCGEGLEETYAIKAQGAFILLHEFITALFYEVDEQLCAIPKHPEAHLWPSEVVTLGLLQALKGGGNRAFYRWLTRDYRPLFPRLPERTRLFRLFATHQDWTRAFLAAPTVLGVIDTYGIELRKRNKLLC